MVEPGGWYPIGRLVGGTKLISILLIVLFAWALVACKPKQDAGSSQVTSASSGKPLEGSRGEIYRLMEDGSIRRISDWPTYLALGYQEGDPVPVSGEELEGYPLGMTLTRWVTSPVDSSVYLLAGDKRYRVPNAEAIEAMGGTLRDVSLVPDEFLESFALEPDPLPNATISNDQRAYPKSSAVLWADGFLWTANETGLLTRWDVDAQNYAQYRLPGEPVIRALASDRQVIYAGTEGGDIWALANDGAQTRILDGEFGWISALTFDNTHKLWYADVSHLDRADFQYHLGRGLTSLRPDPKPGGSQEGVYQISATYQVDHDPLKDVTSMTFDPMRSILWIGTHSAGLLGYDIQKDSWQIYNIFNSNLVDSSINTLELAPDGTLWLATASGVSSLSDGIWENYDLVPGSRFGGSQSLAIARDNTVWAAGESYIARLVQRENWRVYRVTDNPLIADRIHLVVLDARDHTWLIGRRGKVHFDGSAWTAYDADVRRFARFTPVEAAKNTVSPPLDFPSPVENYTAWLKTWPRPQADNGRGIHFLQSHQFDTIDAQRQVNRMKGLGVRWTVVHYADHDQLVRIAPIFQEAGITVIWRPFVRPYQSYPSWAEDIGFLRSRGLAPYMQLYNEPSLAQEWDELHTVDQETYLRHLLPAVRQVFDAGGYVGLQFVNPDWLRLTLRALQDQGMGHVFDRLFFVPHLYGLNHPPDYGDDINSVLGFREFARVFREEIGFVPVMIAGEGGWRLGEAQDSRYPAISEGLHRDYHLAVFEWFRTGQLPDGESLPDYLFAFCPWLISDPNDPAAWFDSASGNRELTIKAVQAVAPFERAFSWDDGRRVSE